MLKWVSNLSKKSDHPINQLNEAKKLLAELPLHDAFKSLLEITSWLESISYASGFRLDKRVEIIQLLEEVGIQHQRKLKKVYLVEAQLQKYQEQRIWTAIFNFYKALSVAHLLCIKQYQNQNIVKSKPGLQLVCARALRALAKQIKWQQMRYGPIDLQLWNDIGKIYSLVENSKLCREKIFNAGILNDTSIEQEFIKPLILAVAAPGGLLAYQLEIADKLIGHFSKSFVLTTKLAENTPYYFDLAKPKRPRRWSGTGDESDKLRFFGIAAAETGLLQLETSLKKGVIPPELNLGGTYYRPNAVLEVVRHLLTHLSNKAIARKHSRRKITVTLNVVYGYSNVLESIQNPNHVFRKTKENWIIENISLGGFSAVIPHIVPFNMRTGCLLSLWTNEGVYWGVGVIRHLQRNHEQHGQVGIQSISQAAQAVILRPLLADRKWHTFEETINVESFPAALLVGTGKIPGEIYLLLKRGCFVKTHSFEMRVHGEKRLLMPLMMVEKGEDYEIAKFKELEYSEAPLKNDLSSKV